MRWLFQSRRKLKEKIDTTKPWQKRKKFQIMAGTVRFKTKNTDPKAGTLPKSA